MNFKSANSKCFGTVETHGNKVSVKGRCLVPGDTLRYMASAMADSRSSYMGSGLPFATPEMAYEGTANRGELTLSNSGYFTFELNMPNSYYVQGGTKLIAPHVHITVGNDYFNIPLGDGIGNRSLTNLPGRYIRTERK